MNRSAMLSHDGRYRWRLDRKWGPGGRVLWIMLNPSTADGEQDDPTIRKCVGFAKRWNYGGIVVVNLFAYRSTEPAALGLVVDPVGPENDCHIREQAGRAQAVIAAWGAKDSTLVKARAAHVMGLLSARTTPVYALRLTKKGWPEHPLYVPYEVEAIKVGRDAWRRP